MAVPDGITRLVLSGTLAGGVEKWAVGIFFEGMTEPPASGSIDLDLIESNTQFIAFRTAVCACLTPSDALTQYDAYWYSGGEAVAHVTKAVSHVGTASTVGVPLQVACVLSLRTALATRRGRGRIYIPFRIAGVVSSTGLSTPLPINTMVDTLAAWFASMASGGVVSAVVVSQTGGFATPITSVQADNVLDTQRRRRNKLVGPVHTADATP